MPFTVLQCVNKDIIIIKNEKCSLILLLLSTRFIFEIKIS